ncbi:MAG: hypothetical protein ICCCNLDF_00303 [Planctomycetes bacterium]|nr:hypothetical protein [Planctomycetota bacterium]
MRVLARLAVLARQHQQETPLAVTQQIGAEAPGLRHVPGAAAVPASQGAFPVAGRGVHDGLMPAPCGIDGVVVLAAAVQHPHARRKLPGDVEIAAVERVFLKLEDGDQVAAQVFDAGLRQHGVDVFRRAGPHFVKAHAHQAVADDAGGHQVAQAAASFMQAAQRLDHALQVDAEKLRHAEGADVPHLDFALEPHAPRMVGARADRLPRLLQVAQRALRFHGDELALGAHQQDARVAQVSRVAGRRARDSGDVLQRPFRVVVADADRQLDQRLLTRETREAFQRALGASDTGLVGVDAADAPLDVGLQRPPQREPLAPVVPQPHTEQSPQPHGLPQRQPQVARREQRVHGRRPGRRTDRARGMGLQQLQRFIVRLLVNQPVEQLFDLLVVPAGEVAGPQPQADAPRLTPVRARIRGQVIALRQPAEQRPPSPRLDGLHARALGVDQAPALPPRKADVLQQRRPALQLAGVRHRLRGKAAGRKRQQVRHARGLRLQHAEQVALAADRLPVLKPPRRQHRAVVGGSRAGAFDQRGHGLPRARRVLLEPGHQFLDCQAGLDAQRFQPFEHTARRDLHRRRDFAHVLQFAAQVRAGADHDCQRRARAQPAQPALAHRDRHRPQQAQGFLAARKGRAVAGRDADLQRGLAQQRVHGGTLLGIVGDQDARDRCAQCSLEFRAQERAPGNHIWQRAQLRAQHGGGRALTAQHAQHQRRQPIRAQARGRFSSRHERARPGQRHGRAPFVATAGRRQQFEPGLGRQQALQLDVFRRVAGAMQRPHQHRELLVTRFAAGAVKASAVSGRFYKEGRVTIGDHANACTEVRRRKGAQGELGTQGRAGSQRGALHAQEDGAVAWTDAGAGGQQLGETLDPGRQLGFHAATSEKTRRAIVQYLNDYSRIVSYRNSQPNYVNILTITTYRIVLAVATRLAQTTHLPSTPNYRSWK